MPRKRKICYLTGTRADFGLVRSTLEVIDASAGLDLSVLVTGAHLSPAHGFTGTEVRKSGFRIAGEIETLPASDSGGGMARGIALGLLGITQTLECLRPDLLLVLGDRGEMLAGTLAAIHLKIPVAHLHGGEVSGTIDESIRHAITKLAHFHLTATRKSAERVVRLGEEPRRVFRVGAPGLDAILGRRFPPTREACRRNRIDSSRPYLLVVQHPVLQESSESGAQMAATLQAVLAFGFQVVVSEPNSDAGRAAMARVLRILNGSGGRCLSYPDIPREDFLSLLAGAAVLVGNSSSGIIEAASLGVPVVNVGSRQNGRERNPNVLDVPNLRPRIEQAVRKALHDKTFRRRVARRENVYGDGQAAKRIARILGRVPLTRAILQKVITY